ncbi:MAG: DinB family protein [Lentimonas sp.]
MQTALQQQLDILVVLSADTYRAASSGPFTSSVGMHLRHNLDHFEAFFQGLSKGQIDYESRGRNTMIEELPEVATVALQKTVKQLDTLRSQEVDEVLQVREESEVGTVERFWLESSIGRELQFLLGHTVHHNALIGMIMRGHGIDLPASFGVAPSTQRHEQGQPATS